MIALKKFRIAFALVASVLSSPAFAQASFTAKDAGNTTRTFASFNCAGVICSMAVPADVNGAAFGVTANPFYMAFGTGVQLPAFAATPTFNLGNINGAAPSLTNPIWVSPATGSSFPVTGTFWQTTQPVSAAALPLPTGAATQSTLASILTALGSPFQAGASIGNTSFGISGTLPAFAATPTVNLGTLGGAATAANQTNASQKTQIVDGSGNVIASTSNNLNVQCANCSGSGVSTADNATFTANASLFAGIGGVYQATVTSNPLTAGHQGFAQLTQYRALMTNPRDSGGGEILGTVTQAHSCSIGGYTVLGCLGQIDDDVKAGAGNFGAALPTGGIAVGLSQGGNLKAPTAVNPTGTVIAQQMDVASLNGVTTLTGQGPTGAGAQRTTLSQDSASVPINISTATTTQLIPASGSTNIYVTSMDVIAGGTGNITFQSADTGGACANPVALTGAYPLTAQAGIAKGSGIGAVWKLPAGKALCALTSQAVQMSGSVSYMQF